MIDYLPYLCAGALWLVAILCLVKYSERLWLAPSGLFFVALFLHGYVDPMLRIGRDPVLDIQNLKFILLQTLIVTLGVTVGYISVQFALLGNGRPKSNVNSLPPFFGKLGSQVASLAVVFVIAAIYLVLILSGGLDTGKGSTSYQGGIYRQMLAVSFAIYSLILALYMSVVDTRGKVRSCIAGIVWFSVSAVAFYSILQFGRMTIVFVLLCMFIYRHNRMAPLRLRGFAIGSLVIVLITVVSLGRQYAEGISEVGFFGILSLVYGLGEEFLPTIGRALGMSLPGQAVFSQTVNLVPTTEPFRYGSTYIDSFMSLFLPNAMTGNYESNTPAFWFKDVYAPFLQGHGFDFSMMAEAYLNFGVYMSAVFVVVGMLLAMFSFTIRRSKSPIAVLWSIILVVDLIVGLRNDSNAVFTRAFYFVVPVLLILGFERLMNVVAIDGRYHVRSR